MTHFYLSLLGVAKIIFVQKFSFNLIFITEIYFSSSFIAKMLFKRKLLTFYMKLQNSFSLKI